MPLYEMSATTVGRETRLFSIAMELRRTANRPDLGKATSHEDERGLRTDRGTAHNCIGIERTEEGDEVGYGSLEFGTEMCCGKGSEKGDLSWKTGRNSNGIGASGGLGRGFWTYVVFSKNKGRVGEK